jgi:hypothetical protein
MNDMFLLEPSSSTTPSGRGRSLPVRYRKWRRRIQWDGPEAATNEKNWIN